MLNDLPTVQRFRAPPAFTQLPATLIARPAPVPASKLIGFPNPSKSLASFQGVRGRFALTVPCRERFFSLVTSRDVEHPFVCAFTGQRADMALNNCPFVLSNANGSNAPMSVLKIGDPTASKRTWLATTLEAAIAASEAVVST